MCKKISNKGLQTFHGVIGYCIKDADKDHFKTINHNILVGDIILSLEQSALHRKEQCKTPIMLTQTNFV